MMHEFTVWAPSANRVSVKLALSGSGRDVVTPMTGPDERGWWRTLIAEAEYEADYAFLLDDDPTPYPDPRSLWQPKGVHGPSRLYDHKGFQWNDRKWQGPPLSGAVLYELHIGTFSDAGTFDGAIERLDHLADLGITHVEIMPVAAFAGDRGWGYDGVAFFAVTENYGGPDGLKRFVNACHEKGLAVILDVVYNHFGPVGNYTTKFGPYLTHRHSTPWGAAVNFEDAGSDEVRRYFCDNALMWMRDFHIDGLRLDAVHELVDRSAVHFMEQLSAEVERLGAMLGRKLVLIAESDLNDPKIVRPREAGGYGMDAQWTDDFHHALFTLLHMEQGTDKGYFGDFGKFEALVKSLTRIFVYDGAYSTYRKRSHGRPVEGLSAHHFIGFIQNHDQVGNRALGDRLEHIVGADLAKVALGLVLTAPFLPMLFMGEEFATSSPFLYFANHDDEQMAKLVAAGRKKEFAAFGFEAEEVPDPESEETFIRSKLNWSEVHEGPHAEMLEWTRRLIRLRRNSVSLNDGDPGHVRIEFDGEHRCMRMTRGDVQVLVNLGKGPSDFDLPAPYRVALASSPEVQMEGAEITLPANTLVILSCEAE